MWSVSRLNPSVNPSGVSITPCNVHRIFTGPHSAASERYRHGTGSRQPESKESRQWSQTSRGRCPVWRAQRGTTAGSSGMSGASSGRQQPPTWAQLEVAAVRRCRPSDWTGSRDGEEDLPHGDPSQIFQLDEGT